MNTQKSLGIFLSLVILISCDKENDQTGNDLALQKFWEFSGYYDYNNNTINLPGFHADTIYQYEVNIQFLWNEFSKMYEIQGHAPYDLFWGEFSNIQNYDLELLSLETTGRVSDNNQLAQYDKLFFSTLNEVSSYSIKENKLFLYYGNNYNYILFELKENQYKDAKEYIHAKIDGMQWSGDDDYTSAYIVYNRDTELFNIEFGGTSQDTLVNGIRYDISFSINLTPAKGEYIFNNEGASLNSDGGIMGKCYGRHKDYHIDTRSTDGSVSITMINRSFIEGYFNFQSFSGEDNVTYHISEGEFLIQLNSPSDWFVPYEFE